MTETPRCEKHVTFSEWDSGDVFRWERRCELKAGHRGQHKARGEYSTAPPPIPDTREDEIRYDFKDVLNRMKEATEEERGVVLSLISAPTHEALEVEDDNS